jgi:hypothetical protein
VGARRLGQDEQYLTVREILSEASTRADGVLSRERSDFYRFGCATLGLSTAGVIPLLYGVFQVIWPSLPSKTREETDLFSMVPVLFSLVESMVPSIARSFSA